MSNSSSSKKIAIVAIVAVIIIALWFVMKKPATPSVSPQANADTSVASQTATVVNAMPADPAVLQVKGSGVSDASLNQDSVAVDAQLNGLSTDSKNASASK